jgi:phosphate/sulfate permease
VKTFEDKVNIKMKKPMESQPTKKKHAVSLSAIFNFVGASFQKRQCATKIVSRELGYSCCKK